MKKAKFQFTSDGVDYMLWAWKGDYLNLGAGAELGIYSNKSGFFCKVNVTSPIKGHWLVDTTLAMSMTLKLKYKKKTIINWDPKKDKNYDWNKVWWLTGFNPYYTNVKASKLKAIYTVKFNTKAMYKSFYKKYGKEDSKKKDDRWTFNPKTRTARFKF